ncbi:MAG: hemerythrin domain-containing protein [Anaerolineales bacterium]|nr:hemerythrin domain-containing protein [Anaerolineales bacterium]
MDGADLLAEEHRVILQVIDALEKSSLLLQAGSAVRAGFFLKAADFIRNFADGNHIRKEEEILIPSMMEAGLSNRTGPVAILLAEHAQARMYSRAMEKAARVVESDPSAAREEVFLNAQGYATLLRQHIRREDDFFFPLAVRLIPPDQQKKVSAEILRFDNLEFGPLMRKRYRMLVQAIVAEAAG